MVLEIVEPPMAGVQHPGVHTLTYPIGITAVPLQLPPLDEDSPSSSPPPADDDQHRRRRRTRRRHHASTVAPVQSVAEAGPSLNMGYRAPVHDCLGPRMLLPLPKRTAWMTTRFRRRLGSRLGSPCPLPTTTTTFAKTLSAEANY